MRVVAVGASNLTRGLQALADASRQAWGPDVEILAALGHGRSYGATSRFLVRSLPGILQSGLWRAMERDDRQPTRAVVSDVGNDILYGHPAERVLGWVEETLDRLQHVTSDVTLTGLPVEGIGGLSPARFAFFRSLFVPSCRLSLSEAAERAWLVHDGLERLARGRGVRFVALRREWYGVDPVHIRPAAWTTAWREILGAPAADAAWRSGWSEAVRLYLAQPEQMRLLGLERRRTQPAYVGQVRLSLY